MRILFVEVLVQAHSDTKQLDKYSPQLGDLLIIGDSVDDCERRRSRANWLSKRQVSEIVGIAQTTVSELAVGVLCVKIGADEGVKLTCQL